MLALFTMDSARLDSIILTMLFSGYNIETVHCALSVTAEAAWSHCGGWLSVPGATSSLRPGSVRG